MSTGPPLHSIERRTPAKKPGYPTHPPTDIPYIHASTHISIHIYALISTSTPCYTQTFHPSPIYISCLHIYLESAPHMPFMDASPYTPMRCCSNDSGSDEAREEYHRDTSKKYLTHSKDYEVIADLPSHFHSSTQNSATNPLICILTSSVVVESD